MLLQSLHLADLAIFPHRFITTFVGYYICGLLATRDPRVTLHSSDNKKSACHATLASNYEQRIVTKDVSIVMMLLPPLPQPPTVLQYCYNIKIHSSIAS